MSDDSSGFPMSQETRSLIQKAWNLVSDEHRALENITNTRSSKNITRNDDNTKTGTNSNVKNKPESVKDARKRIRKEWDALINSSRPLDDSISHILIGTVVYIEMPDRVDLESLKLDLLSMGATVSETYTKEVTHIIFKNGSLETYKRAKLTNVFLVSALWVESCKTSKNRMSEKLYPVREKNNYSNSPRVFRKFMEYEAKHFEYDENRGTLIRKTQQNLPSIIANFQNLNIEPDEQNEIQSNNSIGPNAPNDPAEENSSTEESINMVLSSNNSSTNSEHQINADNNTCVKRKLFTKYPREMSFIVCTPENEHTDSEENVQPSPVDQNTELKKNREIIKTNTNNRKEPKTKSPVKKNIKSGNMVLRSPFKNTNKGSYKKPSLVSTFLHKEENLNLRNIVKSMGTFDFKFCVDATTTHVVAGEPRRTINLLKGIARGCWILTMEWVKESVSAGHWVFEESFELVSFSPVIRRARTERQAFKGDFKLNIFDDCGPIFISDVSDPPREDLYQLVRLCSGTVVRTIEPAKIVVGKAVPDKICVSEKWILDSISSGRYKTISKYSYT